MRLEEFHAERESCPGVDRLGNGDVGRACPEQVPDPGGIGADEDRGIRAGKQA